MKAQFAYVLAGLAIVASSSAFAQSADAKYCKALAEKTTTVTRGGGTTTPAEIPVAISKCDSGDKGAIATLEKYLTDNKQALPAR